MKKSLLILTAALLSLGSLAFFIVTYWAETKNATLLKNAISSYERGAVVEAWVMVKDQSEKVLELENGCELYISTAMETSNFGPGKEAALKCLKLKKGVGIAHEAVALALVKEAKLDEAISLLKEELKAHAHPRIYISLARVSLMKEDLEGAKLAFLEALRLASPWSPYLDQALSSKVSEDKDFLVKALEIVMIKSEKAASTERKLMMLLWRNGLMSEGNSLRDRLGVEATPPVAETPGSAMRPSAGKLKPDQMNELPPGHPTLPR